MSVAVAAAALVLLAGSSAASSTLDLNPAVGVYQDETDCFPFKSNLRQIYRNFESDPYFGGEAKCIRTGPTGPLVDSSLNTTFEYGSDGKIGAPLSRLQDVLPLPQGSFCDNDFLVTLMSSPGYTARNVIHFQPRDESLEAFNFTVAYRDCQRCKVFRHGYIENGKHNGTENILHALDSTLQLVT
ncbi:hypothetical protein V5799_009127 [Amblyomma americanum]|uniref:Secreted protein n=1 Tax=Amblyomma americanum TaxID=6943 RepID=A0AAQ4FD37_AMBAM